MTSSIRTEFRAAPTAVARRALSTAAARIDDVLTARVVGVLAPVLVSVAFVLAVVAYASTNAFTSDDVAVQNIIAAALRGEPLAPVVGGDNFAVKVPLYLLVGSLLPNGPVALVLTVLACDAPLVIALLLVARTLAKPRGRTGLLATHALLAWFLASRITTNSSLMIPNGRNGEIGVAVLLLWWWGRTQGRRSERALILVSVPVLTALFFSDDFFLYVLGPGAVLTALIAWITRRAYVRTAVLLAAVVAVAGAGSIVLTKAAAAAGMQVLQNYANAVPAAGTVPDLMAASIGAVARNLNGDAAGAPLGAAVVPAAGQVALTVMLIGLTAVVVRSGRDGHDLFSALALALIAVNVGLYIGTSNAGDPGSFRYVLLAAVLLLLLGMTGITVLTPTALRTSRALQVFAVVALVAIALGVALNGRTTARAMTGALPDPQARTHEVLQIAADHGLTVGLGDYWDANITTYFSGGRVHLVPQQCTPAGVVPRAWLVNRSELDRTADRMFVVLRTASGCTAKVVEAEFGAPAERVPLAEAGDAVWIYDRALP